MNKSEVIWNDVQALASDVEDCMRDLAAEIENASQIPSEHSDGCESEAITLLDIENRVSNIQSKLDDVLQHCAFLRGYEHQLEKLSQDPTEDVRELNEEEKVEELHGSVMDDGNLLLHCTCGTVSCFEIGQSFAHRWLLEGLSARKISATIKSQAFYNYCRSKGYGLTFGSGVALWQLKNGEQVQSASYDFDVWRALRNFFVATHHIPDSDYQAPDRLRNGMYYGCAHEGCTKDSRTLTVGKYETFTHTQK